MNEEMQALCKNKTWDLVPHSPHKKAIGCRWIFKVKYSANDSVNHYKARLVAKGYAQTHMMTIVWTVIALVVVKG